MATTMTSGYSLLCADHILTHVCEAFAHKILVLHGNPIRKVSYPRDVRTLRKRKAPPVTQPPELTVSPPGGLSPQGGQAAPVHAIAHCSTGYIL